MTASQRRNDAATFPVAAGGDHARKLWQAASDIRQEWLGHALSTQPADRRTAESSLTAIYARIGRPRPRFEWVDSPAKALPLIVGLPTLAQLHNQVRNPRPGTRPPLASDLAMEVSRLRAALSAGVTHADPELSPARRNNKTGERWPELPPLDALASGVPLGVVLHQGVRTALHRSLGLGWYLPVRSALRADEPVPVCWYGQQDASWIGYYDVLHRLGLARYETRELDHLGIWAALARSCGWWWPGEHVCVVVERPDTVRTEPVAGAPHGEVRLHQRGVRYRDGWEPLLT